MRIIIHWLAITAYSITRANWWSVWLDPVGPSDKKLSVSWSLKWQIIWLRLWIISSHSVSQKGNQCVAAACVRVGMCLRLLKNTSLSVCVWHKNEWLRVSLCVCLCVRGADLQYLVSFFYLQLYIVKIHKQVIDLNPKLLFALNHIFITHT